MPNKAQQNATTILNTVRSYASEGYRSVIPTVTETTELREFARPLISEADEYTPIQNEFVKTLINRIVLTIVESKMYRNHLGTLKQGYMLPLGTDIQHIYTNPTVPTNYDGKNLSGILKFWDSDVKVAYYRRNRREVFPVTVSREQLAGAFTSWEKFNEFVSSLVNAMYSGNEIREYNEFKHAIVSAVNDNRVVVRSVEYPNENNAKSIVKEIKTVASNMEFPRTDYNRYAEIVKQKTGETVTPVTTWTDRNRKVIIMRTDVLESLSVEVLASAFNMSEADFRNNLVTVDTFDYDVVDYETRKITGRVKSDLMFVIADMSAFQIYDNLKKVAGDFLSSSLNWQLFLHIWQTIGICPFANFVAYTSSSNPELLGVSLSDYVAELTDVAPTKEIAYEFTPDNYIGGVKVNPLSITKDGVSVDISTADTVFPIVVNNDTKSFTINNKTGGEAGVYECKFTVSADTGALFPNAILSVSRTIS